MEEHIEFENLLIENKKLLFVCAANTQRSPTFEKWFKTHRPQYDVRSTGIYYGYPYILSSELLDWADKVYLMDLSQELFIHIKYPKYISKCEVIGISDQYSQCSEDLIHLIWYWCRKNGL